MGEMVERVARAMWEARERRLNPYVRVSFEEGATEETYDMARAAIAAMREPTKAMEWAGSHAVDTDGPWGAPPIDGAWQAMIDEALKP
jgi:hypothetical protein